MINYKNVVTDEEFDQLGLDKVEFIKQRAQKIKNKYDFEIHIRATHNARQTRNSIYRNFDTMANDEINKQEYKAETDIYKKVLKSNIVFPNSNKLFNILLDNNVSFKMLSSISKRVSNLKLLSYLNQIVNDILGNKYTTDEVNEKIDNIFKILLDKNILTEIPKSKVLEQKLQIIKIIIKKLSEKTNSDKNLETIIKKLNHYYSINDYELIITRLIQIVTYEKEEYIDLENSKIKKLK